MTTKEHAGDLHEDPQILPEGQVLPEGLDPADIRPVISCAIDDVAMAALRERGRDSVALCNLCGDELEAPTSSGLFMWSRGDDVRFEEPPLCARCAAAVGLTAFLRWPYDDVEG